MDWLATFISNSHSFLASEALLPAFEIVVAAAAAFPSTIWEIKFFFLLFLLSKVLLRESWLHHHLRVERFGHLIELTHLRYLRNVLHVIIVIIKLSLWNLLESYLCVLILKRRGIRTTFGIIWIIDHIQKIGFNIVNLSVVHFKHVIVLEQGLFFARKAVFAFSLAIGIFFAQLILNFLVNIIFWFIQAILSTFLN